MAEIKNPAKNMVLAFKSKGYTEQDVLDAVFRDDIGEVVDSDLAYMRGLYQRIDGYNELDRKLNDLQRTAGTNKKAGKSPSAPESHDGDATYNAGVSDLLWGDR